MTKDPVYIVKRGSEYLVSRVETPTLSGIYKPVFSIYRYDAARIKSQELARAVIKRIRRHDEKWQVCEFNPLTGDERTKAWIS